MPWIKAEISESAHKDLKHRSIDEEQTLSEVVADVLEDATNE